MKCKVRISILNKLKSGDSPYCISQESLSLKPLIHKKISTEKVPFAQQIADLKLKLLAPILSEDDIGDLNAKKEHDRLKSYCSSSLIDAVTP